MAPDSFAITAGRAPALFVIRANEPLSGQPITHTFAYTQEMVSMDRAEPFRTVTQFAQVQARAMEKFKELCISGQLLCVTISYSVVASTYP